MAYAFVYIVTNKPNGVFYIGVTTNLPQRAMQHRLSMVNGFSKKYNLHHLVWYEAHEDMSAAIRREKAVKRWTRAMKIERIEQMNPNWQDLGPGLGDG